MRVLVILPTYNERDNIESILRAAHGVLPDAGILVVDDSSPDGTAEIAGKVAADIGTIELLVRPKKEGLGPAYREGFRWGLEQGYDVLVEMDSDFSHDPSALPRLIAPIEDGAELVVGSRYVPGGAIPDWTTGRRLLSRFGNLYAKFLLGFDVEDSTAGFRAYAATLLQRIDLDEVRADSYGFQVEMTYRASLAGAKIVEVPIEFVDRVEGTSKMSAFTVAEALVLVTYWGARRLVVPAYRRIDAKAPASHS
ncbi:MAG TPA: polyprenol monophosphomannose synthase [Acidimicrobiales bacterium]|nr:polyprenol monophosphomannose synthase [Acidimicrobiales bacterium]